MPCGSSVVVRGRVCVCQETGDIIDDLHFFRLEFVPLGRGAAGSPLSATALGPPGEQDHPRLAC